MLKRSINLLKAAALACIVASPVWAEPVSLSGKFVQGGLVVGKTDPANTVSFNGKALPVSAEGFFVLGFDRDGKSGDVLKVQGEQGVYEQHLEIAKRDYDIQRVEGISQKIMSPNAEDLARINRDNALVGKARAQTLEREDFHADFHWPLLGPITGVFGSQRVYNGQPSRPHYGVDVAAPVGTLVKAPAPGVVTLAHNDMFYSGGTLIIDHGHGLSSSFLHLSKILVKVGDEIKPGQVIAEVGATGRANGPHLDWRMNWNERRVDPQLLVPAMPVQHSEKQ